MKKLLFTFVLALLATVSVWAQTFTAGNLTYKVTDAAAKTVKLIGYVTKPTGALTIPATVTNGGTTYSVTAIGKLAFYECGGITSVTIPDGVTGIGQSAFKFCSALSSVTIPDGMTSIGGYAFESCIALSSVTIPESVTSIGDYAFSSCSFTEVNIPGNITVIEEGVFNGCGKLTKISIPVKVTAIGQFAFHECYALKEVTIGKEVKEIGANAFANCFKLAKMTVQAIDPPIVGAGAFFNVERDIPVYVREGSSYHTAPVWNEFTNLKTWEIPSFTVDNLKYGIPEPGDESVEIIGYETKPEGRLAIPETVAYEGKNYNVTMIGYAAFMDCSALTEVIIPDKITRILNDAFYACNNLGTMTVLAKVPPKVDDGMRTFYGVKREIPVYVPAESLEAYKAADVWSWFNLQAYDPNKFTVGNLQYNILDASAKTVEVVNPVEEVVGRLVIPSTVSYNGTDYIVEALGYGSFYNAKKVTELVLPPTIKLVNDLSFFNCPKMEKLTVLAVNPPSYSENLFPDLEYSRAPVFVPAESLEKYKKTSWAVFNLKAIPKMKFIITDEAAKTVELDGCEPEPEGVLDIPATTVIDGKEYRVTSIGNDAFRDCTKITEVIIPESVTVIARYAFNGCSALSKVTIPESVTTIGIYAFGYTGITEVTLPGSLTKIEEGLFSYSTYLSELTIGENVTEIGNYAFAANNLYEMTILANVPPTLGKDVFWNISNTVVVYVPFGTSEAYKAAAGWKDFKNIRELPLIVDNLIYATTDAKAAEVIGYETEPAGVLNIPATITHNGMDYSVESIAESAFNGCHFITKVTVPNNVTTIGDYAFQGCTSCVVLILGESVENIGVGAFATCNVLKEMTVLATVPPVTGAEVFYLVDREIPVYVPAESLEAYKAAEVWKEFTNLQAISGTAIDTPSMPESISIQGGMLHNPQQLPVIIYDLTGRLVYSGNATTVELPAGMYIVSCNGASRKAVF